MIIDAFQCFDLPNAPRNLAQVAGTYDSTNILDYGILSGIPSSANGGGARDMGIGDDPALKLVVQAIAAFVGGTSVQVQLKGAIDDGTGAPAAFSTWWTSPVYVTATLVAGARLFNMDFPRPPAGIAVPRFVKLSYVTLGTFTAGTMFAAVVLDRDDQMYQSTNNAVLGGYPAGITVAN